MKDQAWSSWIKHWPWKICILYKTIWICIMLWKDYHTDNDLLPEPIHNIRKTRRVQLLAPKILEIWKRIWPQVLTLNKQDCNLKHWTLTARRNVEITVVKGCKNRCTFYVEESYKNNTFICEDWVSTKLWNQCDNVVFINSVTCFQIWFFLCSNLMTLWSCTGANVLGSTLIFAINI